MGAYSLFTNGKLHGLNLGLDVNINDLDEIENIHQLLENLKNNQDILIGYSVDDLLEFFDKLSNSWQSNDHPLKKYDMLGLNFLIQWLRYDNLSKICDASLKNNRYLLDGYYKINNTDKLLIRALQMGIIGHWIAGNIPILGMISLVQGILTKNLNIVRVSQRFGYMLPLMLDTFRQVEFKNQKGELISGEKIAKTICAIYYDKKDKEFANSLSQNINVRVVWGGYDAVESIIGLKKSLDTVDIIFGPKYSFSIIDHSYLSDKKIAKTIAQKLAFDISSFEQRGCNSPHTLFLENGSKINTESFCNYLGEGLEKALRLIPKEKLEPKVVANILNARAEYAFNGKVVSSKGTEWSVLFSENEEGMAEPCYGRTIFVRQVNNVFDVVEYVTDFHQSVGLAVSDSIKLKLAENLSCKGVARCPDIGSMSLYEVPWDGIFPMERMVKWVSVYE